MLAPQKKARKSAQRTVATMVTLYLNVSRTARQKFLIGSPPRRHRRRQGETRFAGRAPLGKRVNLCFVPFGGSAGTPQTTASLYCAPIFRSISIEIRIRSSRDGLGGPEKTENFFRKRMKEKIFFADYLKFRDFPDFSKSNGCAGSNIPVGSSFRPPALEKCKDNIEHIFTEKENSYHFNYKKCKLKGL